MEVQALRLAWFVGPDDWHPLCTAGPARAAVRSRLRRHVALARRPTDVASPPINQLRRVILTRHRDALTRHRDASSSRVTGGADPDA